MLLLPHDFARLRFKSDACVIETRFKQGYSTIVCPILRIFGWGGILEMGFFVFFLGVLSDE
ncbi:hypothetical protein TPSD3_03045 [Thioflexithrix psekupsensis]|uniref:Uncharacterized protein n=1 Tax=Thioflexithrix psekupsensis TaxID=1570016 RepID=A0A251XB45_9GAMM|nr:hypothetical protein TPSD3_03045 [Thioflexithrix psekupsensis]